MVGPFWRPDCDILRVLLDIWRRWLCSWSGIVCWCFGRRHQTQFFLTSSESENANTLYMGVLDDICVCFNSLSKVAPFSGWQCSAELNWQRRTLPRSQLCQRTRSRSLSQALLSIIGGEGWWYHEHDFYLSQFGDRIVLKYERQFLFLQKLPLKLFLTLLRGTWLCLKWGSKAQLS